MFFKNFKVWETELAGRKLTLETGKMAGLANAAILARYGETEVLCTVTASAKPREGVDFFPLSVDYEEKMYSVGRIPGSFLRREGRASEKAILTSRCIDRPIRPLFPKDLRNDCSVVATVMSVDEDCSPEITAAIGVSAAIAISDIPWDGPISSVNVGLVDGEIVINPTLEQRAKTDLTLTVASTADLVAMIEAGGNEIDDDTMFDAIMAGHEENKKIVKFIQGIVDEIGKPKFEYESSDPDPEIMDEIEEFCIEDVKKALDTDGPAGAGKSTIAKAAAKKLGFIYVDTGALYRTVALNAVRQGAAGDSDKIIQMLKETDVKLGFADDGSQRVYLNGEDVSDLIRTPEISMAASSVSAIPQVRAFLLDLQRDIAKNNDVIMDGRDIATVVLPNARPKIFLFASPECRAERRYKELIEKGENVTFEDVLEDVNQRDYQDSHREIAPLKPSSESVMADTSKLTLQQSIELIINIIKENMN